MSRDCFTLQAQLAIDDETSKMDAGATDMFEQLYNRACILISQKRFVDAIKLLLEAESAFFATTFTERFLYRAVCRLPARRGRDRGGNRQRCVDDALAARLLCNATGEGAN